MSLYMTAFMRNLVGEEVTNHGWIITQDFLDPDETDNLVGNQPTDMHPDVSKCLNDALAGKKAPKAYRTAVFDMYDDDGERYVRGRIAWPADEEPDEEVLYAPLRWGSGMGCTRINFPGHPGWAIG